MVGGISLIVQSTNILACAYKLLLGIPCY